MKLSVFENLNVLKANLKYTFLEETAYWSNNIASVFSTLFYNITYLMFIEVLFSNVDSIAGYNKNQMLLFYFFAECSAYYFGTFIFGNLNNLIKSVNDGTLDLLLTKPVNALFYLSTWKIKLFGGIRDAIPPLIIVFAVIDWNSLNLNPLNFIAGLLIFVIGMQIITALLWIASLPVFWIGESDNILSFIHETWFSAGATVPLEGLSSALRVFFTFVIPGLIPAALASSVALGKNDPLAAILVALAVFVIFWLLRIYLWKVALRAYTSASS